MAKVTDPALIAQLETTQGDINKGSDASDPKLVESERTAAFLGTNLAGGIQDINRALAEESGAQQPGAIQAFAGLFSPDLQHTLSDNARRRVEDAQLIILDNALTLGTGAAYTKEQLQNYRSSYFPGYLDDEATIADKKLRLTRLLEAAKLKAGNAAPQIQQALDAVNGQPGTPPPPPGQETPPATPPPTTAGQPGDIGFEAPPAPKGFSGEQATAYDAFMAANPNATAEQIREFGRTQLGFDIPNADKIVEIRDERRAAGRGGEVAPGGSAVPGLTPEEQAQVDRDADVGPDQAAALAAVSAVPFVDKIAAAKNALSDSIHGKGSFADRYDRNALIIAKLQEELQAGHPIAYTAGQIGAAVAIPSFVKGAAFKGMSQALRAGATRAEAITAGRLAAAKQLGIEGAAFGAAQGASQAESPGQVLPSAITGAVIGGATAAGAGAASVPAAAVARGLSKAPDAINVAAAKAGQELGIEIPKFVVGGEKAAGKAASLEKAGQARISQATNKLLADSEAARRQIAEGVGTPGADDIAMGEAAVVGGNKASKAEKNRIGGLYTQARKGAEGVKIDASNTEFTLRNIAASENEAVGGSKIADVFTGMADKLVERGGEMTVEGARKTRTNLRNQLVNDAGLTRSEATRLTNHVMQAITQDIDDGLKAAGKENVAALFKQADRDWRKLQITEDRYLEPYIGKEGDKAGDEVARQLATDTGGRGIRLAKFLSAIPDEQANTIRATLIDRLGRAKSGQQGAAGDAFSLDTFLTNWDQIRNSRNLIFPKDTVKSLNKLAQIAEASKRAGKKREPSGRTVQQAVGLGAGAVGATAGYSASDSPWGGAAGAIAAPLAIALAKGNSARLLTSPKFAEKLANTPKNPRAARVYWDRVGAGLARSTPELSNEILGFRDSVLEQLGLAEGPAAELQRAPQREPAPAQ